MYNKSVLRLLYAIKFLHAPHAIKYLGFLLIKDRILIVPSRLDISNIVIDLNIGDFIEYWMFMDGLFESKWVHIAKEYVAGKVFIDVGAYIGDYPLALFKHAKSIYAFEPEKNNYEKMLYYIKHNHITNIKAVKAALASHKGKIKIYTSKNKGWHSMTIPYQDGSEQVRALTLDDYVAKNKIHNIGLIKIDVEGAEFEVLSGSLETLIHHRPTLLIEFNRPFTNKTKKYTLTEIYEFLSRRGYVGYRLSNDKLVKITKSYIKKIYFENLLFKAQR
jgi:FkbM family methyltransferase